MGNEISVRNTCILFRGADFTEETLSLLNQLKVISQNTSIYYNEMMCGFTMVFSDPLSLVLCFEYLCASVHTGVHVRCSHESLQCHAFDFASRALLFAMILHIILYNSNRLFPYIFHAVMSIPIKALVHNDTDI